MSSILLAVIVVGALLLGYLFYGTFIENRLVHPKNSAPTPAHTRKDGVDFFPSRKALLFGHHFASIAGAGPIIGPVIAVAMFGWIAVAGWIVVGTIFIGAVHDYLSLMISVRHRGESMAEVSEAVMGARARAVFSIFLWATLILVIAVFAAVGAKTLQTRPQAIIPTFGIIPLAMIFGWAVYRKNFNTVLGTVLGLAILFAMIWLGIKHPITIPGNETSVYNTWLVILMAYALLASVLPVWVLLQPRDYLSMFLLIIGLVMGYTAILGAKEPVHAPGFTSFMSGEKPLWPMLFVIVACGAISGFHCLVSGGTSSKQLNSERDGKFIGYGAMITEGILAALAMIAVAAGLYWKGAAPAGVASDFIYQDVMAEKGWIVAFGNGFGRLVDKAPLGVGFTLASLFAIMMLKTFVLTTLDTAMRLARFIVAESLGARVSLLANRWIAALICAAPVIYLAYGGRYKAIWPVFGATNQLIAALALFVISCYLVGIKRPTIYTIVPAIVMLVTTVAALVLQARSFLLLAEKPQWLLGATCIVLIALAAFVVHEAAAAFLKMRKQTGTDSEPQPT